MASDGVVPMVLGGAEEWTAPDVVQNRCEHELVVGVVGMGEVSGLQGMSKFVNGFLVPYPIQRYQYRFEFVDGVHTRSVRQIGLYQLFIRCLIACY